MRVYLNEKLGEENGLLQFANGNAFAINTATSQFI